MIIPGKSTCLLCSKVLEKNHKLKSFPAFLPNNHKFGKFSDAAMHAECFIQDPDHMAVDDMFEAYRMILDSRPRDLKSMYAIDEWTREAFKDWPPKNGVVIFQPMFPEDSEEGGFWMDVDDYKAMCEAEEEHERQKKAREEEERAHRWDGWRDDDY